MYLVKTKKKRLLKVQETSTASHGLLSIWLLTLILVGTLSKLEMIISGVKKEEKEKNYLGTEPRSFILVLVGIRSHRPHTAHSLIKNQLVKQK
jgi:hypothetical protein